MPWISTEGILGQAVIDGFLTRSEAETIWQATGILDLKITQYIRSPNYQERVGFLSQFEEDFKRVIKSVTRGGKWPLVVFIDDLDRCAPPKPAVPVQSG